MSAAAQLPEVSTDPAGRRVAAVHLACAWVALEEARLDPRRGTNWTRSGWRTPTPPTLSFPPCTICSPRAWTWPVTTDRALTMLDTIGGDSRRDAVVPARGAAGRGRGAPRGRRAWEARDAARDAGGAEGAVALARVHLHERHPAAASRAVRPVLMEPSALTAVRVEAWLLDACLAYREEDRSRGRRSLERRCGWENARRSGCRSSGRGAGCFPCCAGIRAFAAAPAVPRTARLGGTPDLGDVAAPAVVGPLSKRNWRC